MITYDKEKKELIIPADFQLDCSSAMTVAKAEGYQEGLEFGESIGYSSGYSTGYISGWTDGYSSGYTDGRNYQITDICVTSHFNMNDDNADLYSMTYFYLNGEYVEFLGIKPDRLYNLYNIYNEYPNKCFWFSGFSAGVRTVHSMDIEIYFRNNEEPKMNGDEMNIVFNDIPLTITSWSKELIWQAEQPNQQPQRIYQYHWEFNEIELSNYGRGFSDGYISGRTDGYNEGINAPREFSSLTITQNGVYAAQNGGWSHIVANVHEGEVPLPLMEEKVINLDYSTASGFSGDEVFYPSDGFDGISSVEVKGLSAERYHSDMYDSEEGVYGMIKSALNASADTLSVTENGTYTVIGTIEMVYGQHSPWDFPRYIAEVEVNVPLSNVVMSGSFTTTADTVFNSDFESAAVIFKHSIIFCAQDLVVDGVALLSYCDNGYMLPAGSHTFWANIGDLELRSGELTEKLNYFPNLDGSITYSRIYEQH